MTKRQRLNPDIRKDQILSAALTVAKNSGFEKLTRDGVAAEAAVAQGQINRMFATMNQLKSAVMRAAVVELRKCKEGEHDPNSLRIVAYGLVNGQNEATKAPEDIKKAALTLAMG